MEVYPLIHILFWIAMTLSPQDTTQILVTGPDETWSWTKQASGWSKSLDQSVWAVEENTVMRQSGEKSEKHDVSAFVEKVREQDWDESPYLKLGPMRSLQKEGPAFVYTLNEGGRTGMRFIIEFRAE